jgi:hypothetical protein
MPSFRRADAGRGIETPSALNTPLRGARLRLAWLTWAVAVLCGLAFLVAFAPARLLQLHGLAEDNAAGLAQLGLSPQVFVDYLAGLDIALFLVFAAAGVAIFVRKSDTWLTVLVSATLICHGAAMTRPEDSFGAAAPEWRWFAIWLTCVVNSASITALVLLPDGRFVPRYQRFLTAFWVLAIIVRYVFFPQFARPDGRPTAGADAPGACMSLLILMLAIGGFITGGIAQIQRYRRLTDATQRQQIKWYVFGVAVAVAGIVLFQLPAIFIPALRTPGVARVLYALIGVSAFYLAVMVIPVTLAFALLRYRLWEVDTVINRSLVYAALTGAPARRVLRQRRGAPVVLRHADRRGVEPRVVASTLGLALVFQPLRQRVQGVIDRRLYRRTVNFRQAFTEFAREVRTIIDLEQLLSAPRRPHRRPARHLARRASSCAAAATSDTSPLHLVQSARLAGPPGRAVAGTRDRPHVAGPPARPRGRQRRCANPATSRCPCSCRCSRRAPTSGAASRPSSACSPSAHRAPDAAIRARTPPICSVSPIRPAPRSTSPSSSRRSASCRAARRRPRRRAPRRAPSSRA